MAQTDARAAPPGGDDGPASAAGYVYQSALSPDRAAWLVLLLAFAMFCLLTLTAGFAIYTYLFRSTIPLPAALQVAQGTVGITGLDLVETVEREYEDLTNTATSVSTDSLSQATIQFHDLASAEIMSPPLLASVTLQNNTSVTFDHARRPRFDWSLNQLSISLSRLKGALDLLVIGADDKPFALSVSTVGDVEVEIREDGRYRITASEDEARLLTFSGAAALKPGAVDDAPIAVSAGEATIVRHGAQAVETGDAPRNLLSNSSFSLLPAGVVSGTSAPQKWVCLTTQDSPPSGRFGLEEFDGRLGMRLRRLNNATSHGEVSCTQHFGGGADVSGYDSIKLLVTFFLNYQSLSQCATQGSECPLMLHLVYEDEFGFTRDWLRGFHYAKEIETDFPTRCSSCDQDHEVINRNGWYTFESENLLSLLGEHELPRLLRSLRFYASGHQFDAAVSEVMVLVEAADDPPQAAQG